MRKHGALHFRLEGPQGHEEPVSRINPVGKLGLLVQTPISNRRLDTRFVDLIIGQGTVAEHVVAVIQQINANLPVFPVPGKPVPSFSQH